MIKLQKKYVKIGSNRLKVRQKEISLTYVTDKVGIVCFWGLHGESGQDLVIVVPLSDDVTVVEDFPQFQNSS